MPTNNKSYLKRTRLGKNEERVAERTYNNKGQLVDQNNPKVVLKQGQINKGHKYGYENAALIRCAERCGMTQREFNKMNRQYAYKTLQLEDAHGNKGHSFECKDKRVQNHNCMKIIREYKNQNNGKNLQPSIERHGKTFAAEKSPADRAKSNSNFGYRVSRDANGRATMRFGKQLKSKVQSSRAQGKSTQAGKSEGGMKNISNARTTVGKSTGSVKASSGAKSAGAGNVGKGSGTGNSGGKGSGTNGGKGR